MRSETNFASVGVDVGDLLSNSASRAYSMRRWQASIEGVRGSPFPVLRGVELAVDLLADVLLAVLGPHQPPPRVIRRQLEMPGFSWWSCEGSRVARAAAYSQSLRINFRPMPLLMARFAMRFGLPEARASTSPRIRAQR